MKRLIGIVYIMLLCCCCARCATQSITPAPVRIPTIHTATELSEYINACADRIETIKASGTITLFEEEGPLSYPVTVQYKKPDSIRVHVYKPLFPSLFDLKSSHGKFYFFIPQDKVIYTGTNAALVENLSYDIAITPQVVMGALVSGEIAQEEQTKMHERDKTFELAIMHQDTSGSRLIRTLVCDKTTAQIQKELFYLPQGILWFEITRGGFATDSATGLLLAHTLFIRNTLKNLSLQLSFKKIVTNEPIDDSGFVFEFPKGIDIERIE